MELEENNPFGKKVGLALGSGAARGLAHIGVLQVLEREGIPVDMIAGTSIGALVGGLYAMGKTSAEILDIARDIGTHRLTYLVDVSLPRTGLIKGKKIEDKLEELYGDMEFSDLKMPFKCIATDIDSGKSVVIDKGPLWQAVRASISLPVILAVVDKEDKYLVDGGLVDPVPVDVTRKMGADVVIAVNVMPYNIHRADNRPNIFDVIMQTVQIVSGYAVKDSLRGADIVIEPDVEGFKLSDFHKVDECAEKGEAAAELLVPSIRRVLAKKVTPVKK